MANILLIEPNYMCKYPPLGLMKIAYYHKELRNDIVWFSKGKLPYSLSSSIKNRLMKSRYYQQKYGKSLNGFIDYINELLKSNDWDRVYISTLFTYEWFETIKTIQYVKNIVSNDNIYIGGVLATLMSKEVEEATGVKPITGQLTCSSKLNYWDNVNIDNLTPDYSILDNTTYDYPLNNAYFAYTTRGCGMNCDFCAVKILEPDYVDYKPIKNQIEKVREKYGEKKDLLLLDNNVLKSKKLELIIQDIIDLGFEKGATYLNTSSMKENKRYVDFNQGLDASLITDKKARLLGKIALKPARIAFDHIEDKKTYISAIKKLSQCGITHFSNYMLYNGEDFTSKGKFYKADSPEDLYNRIECNVKLQEEKSSKGDYLKTYSFPMRYIPLDCKHRGKKGYVGKEWNRKYLRAIQCMLRPTQGKGVSSKSFFQAAFGRNVEEYLINLEMPEQYIETRGNPDNLKTVNQKELNLKRKKYNRWKVLRYEWKRIYNNLSENEHKYFLNLIKDNSFDYKCYSKITMPAIRRIYIHYLKEHSILQLLEDLLINMEEELINEINDYFTKECPELIKHLARYIVEHHISHRQIYIFLKIVGIEGFYQIISEWIENDCKNKSILTFFKCYEPFINFYYLYILRWSMNLNLITDEEKIFLLELLKDKRINDFEKLLIKKYNSLFDKLEKKFDEKKLIGRIKSELAIYLNEVTSS